MRLSLACLTSALAMAALIGAAGFGSAALAQSPGTAGPVSLGDLFKGPDSTDLKDGADGVVNAAIVNASMRQCRTQKANIKVALAKSDPLFQQALGQTRSGVIDAVLKQRGVSAERYAVTYGGIGAKDDVQVEYGDIIPDKDKPKLDTNSVPRKGAKVKANDKIVVTMVATDRANEWQTGIKSIQLQDISTNPNGVLVPSPVDYGRLPDACNAATMRRTHVVTYTVPSNPPPIVRLRAIAEDFAGNVDTDIAEFPTGDWYGQLDWRTSNPGPARLWGRLDLAFDYDGRGNLKGRMAGDSHAESPPRGEFCGMTTETPAKLSTNLAGQYTPGRNAMSLRAADRHAEPGKFSMCAIGPGGGPLFMSGQSFEGGGPLGQPGLDQLLNSLTVKADGSVEASGEWPVAPAEAQSTLHLKLTLRKAQN